MNKIFGIKKENHHVGQDHHGPAAVKETVDEGFIVYQHSNAAVIENNQVQGSLLPYSLGTADPARTSRSETTATKLTDEIPFQFSPAYSLIINSNSASSKYSAGLRQIDWDSLNYDFTLEKSILQS